MKMNIDWYRVKYVKGILPYLHRAWVLVVFLVDYVRLCLIRHRVKLGRPDCKLIVINLFEHFGDIVACEPVARLIRNKYPGAYIIWNVKEAYSDLVRYNPHIDEIFLIGCMTEWIYLAQSGLYDEVVDLHPQKRVCPICRKPLLKKCGNADITIDNYYNYGNLLAAYCQSAGIPVTDDRPKVYIPDNIALNVDTLKLPRSFVVFHCLSNEASRDWEPEKWQQLARKIINYLGLPVVEIGLRPVLDLQSDLQVNLCGRLTLLETAELIRRAFLFIGIDSGPAHLANAAGTFGIILLGDYRDFKRYMPYSGGYNSGENSKIICSVGPSAAISVDEVFDAVRSFQSRSEMREP